MSLVRSGSGHFLLPKNRIHIFFAIAKSGRISCPLSKKALHHIPGNSRMDTVQSFFHRMTAQESFSFLQIFDDLPCLIIKFSVLEIILFIFFCNLFYHTARISHGNAPVRNIFCHDASCSDNHITSDMYPRHNNRVSTKPYIITDRYLNPIFISRISCCRMN